MLMSKLKASRQTWATLQKLILGGCGEKVGPVQSLKTPCGPNKALFPAPHQKNTALWWQWRERQISGALQPLHVMSFSLLKNAQGRFIGHQILSLDQYFILFLRDSCFTAFQVWCFPISFQCWLRSLDCAPVLLSLSNIRHRRKGR